MSRTIPRSFTLPPRAERLPDPEIDPAGLEPPLDPRAWAGHAGPLVIDVGFGKGRFLLTEAGARPDALFLGIERSAPYVRLVRHRARARLLSNVRILCAHGGDIFRRLLAPACADEVYVLFPDPWPKRRHNQRRLVATPFLEDVARVLVPGGIFTFVTDHGDYAEGVLRAVPGVPALVPEPRCLFGEDLASRTDFSRKLAARGARFHAHSWSRRK